MNQRGSIIPLLLVALMVGAIIAATQLTALKQIFQSQASNGSGSPFYASVQCGSDGQAVFRWNEIPEAAEYAVVIARGAAGAESPAVFQEVGRRTVARVSLIPGANYNDWAVKVGYKTGGYHEYDQKEFSCNGTTSGEIPANLFTYDISARVTCNTSGQATFEWSAYPGAVNYSVNVYPAGSNRIPLNANQSTSVTTSLQPGGSYADWELIVKLANDTKVFDQTEFSCNGTARGALSVDTPTSTPAPTSSVPNATATPTTVPAQPTPAPVCNGHCASVGETQGNYVCVDDQGDKQWRLPQCTGNSNCDCTATTL